jgi:hypothetical protein
VNNPARKMKINGAIAETKNKISVSHKTQWVWLTWSGVLHTDLFGIAHETILSREHHPTLVAIKLANWKACPSKWIHLS